MKKIVVFLFLIFSFSFTIVAQELFIHNEPASDIPTGVLGVRAFDVGYKEHNVFRNLAGVKLMYGVIPRLSVIATVSTSNHHDTNFPTNLVSHTHVGNQTVYSTSSFQRGVKYPYKYNGLYLYAKYRFLSFDDQNSHFRMAAYADWSTVNVAHDEAEPNLMDDTKGYGGGLITTYLKNHFAVSLTSGVILPGRYNGFAPDSAGPLVPTTIQYGRAGICNLSFGYLVYPKHYKNYNQPNLNIYMELMGKSYQAAQVWQYGDKSVPIQTPLLQSGNFLEARPGVQLIVFNSNLRIDFSTAFPIINKSYTHYYPVYFFALQRYFYPSNLKLKKNKAAKVA